MDRTNIMSERVISLMSPIRLSYKTHIKICNIKNGKCTRDFLGEADLNAAPTIVG